GRRLTFPESMRRPVQRTPQNSGVSPSSGHSEAEETSKHASQLGLLPMGLLSLGSGRSRQPCLVLHFFCGILLCGLRLPMWPLSVPAAGSIAQLIRAGFPEAIYA